eukprot:scaffold264989_cov29-Prasinocladus_malaysianus.AAC.1
MPKYFLLLRVRFRLRVRVPQLEGVEVLFCNVPLLVVLDSPSPVRDSFDLSVKAKARTGSDTIGFSETLEVSSSSTGGEGAEPSSNPASDEKTGEPSSGTTVR